MHPQLVEALIAEEVARARGSDLLRDRVELEQHGTRVLAHARHKDGEVTFALDGPNYDAEPFSLLVVDPETGKVLAGSSWPGGLYFGSDHPTLGRPWSCIKGVYEYYRHESHVAEPWDRDRYAFDLPTLLNVVLNKAECH